MSALRGEAGESCGLKAAWLQGLLRQGLLKHEHKHSCNALGTPVLGMPAAGLTTGAWWRDKGTTGLGICAIF